MSAAKPYDKLPTESSKAYEAFAIYRDLGVNRSTDLVAKQLAKSEQLIRRWSYTYNWVARAAAYDEYIDQQARKVAEREAIKRKADMLQRHAIAGRLLQRKGAEYINQHGMEKSSDAINAIQKGVAMERAAEGLPEYLMEIVNADDDEIARQYLAVLAEIGSIGSGNEAPGHTDTGTSAPAADSSPTDNAE